LKLPHALPANENGGRPPVIPVFVCLLARHDLTRLDVFVYGALVAYEHAGQIPRMRELAPVIGLDTRRLRRLFKRLQERGLIERHGETSCKTTQRYELKGPRLDACG
jgi:predicted transcriptional regulator